MILLDSCAVLEILWGGKEAARIAEFLDGEQVKGIEIVFPRLALLEASSVLSVRYKEGRIIHGSSLEEDLATLSSFVVHPTGEELSIDIIQEAALIKFAHAASMVDCYLIANSLRRKTEILSADREILGYRSSEAVIRKVTRRFSVIRWVSSARPRE